MKRLTFRLFGGALLLFAFALAGCQDLSIDNRYSPDRTRVLGEPSDVEALVAGLFNDTFAGSQYCEPAMALSIAAEELSASWGNWGMQDAGRLPRIAYNNATTYAYSLFNRSPWAYHYTAISNAADALAAINANEANFTAAGIDINRMKAFAKFIQGVSHGFLAAMFDQAFVYDETVDLETATPELVPYTDVMAAAIGYLEEAIAISKANSFTIPAAWMMDSGFDANGTMSSANFARLIHSLTARNMAWVARDPAERAAVNWNAVLNHINQGLSEDQHWTPIGDDGSVIEWDCIKYYGMEGRRGDSWARVDNYTIGPADVVDEDFNNWLNTPAANRQPFLVNTNDRRITGGQDNVGATTDGKYMIFRGSVGSGNVCANGPFPADRGTWHYTCYSSIRWDEYRGGGANGPMTIMENSEMPLLKAEALLRTNGSADEIASILNQSRVTIGEMNPANTALRGDVADRQSSADGASLWAQLKHEFMIETMATQGGLAFFTRRGWGDLVKDTPLHFPVPGRDLEQLQLANYTFGGGGPGSAAGRGPGWKSAPEKEHPKKPF